MGPYFQGNWTFRPSTFHSLDVSPHPWTIHPLDTGAAQASAVNGAANDADIGTATAPPQEEDLRSSSGSPAALHQLWDTHSCGENIRNQVVSSLLAH